MYQDEELHAELMRAFRKYFEANQTWLAKGTKRACMDTRYWMSEIRRICKLRRAELMTWRYEKNEQMKAEKAQKANQNKGTSKADNDN